MIYKKTSYKQIVTYSIVLFLSLCCKIFAAYSSEIFRFDDPQTATGLHVTFTTDTALIQEINKQEASFYEGIFSDPTMMKYFGDGLPYDTDYAQYRITSSLERRFTLGRPNGFLTIKDKNNPTCLLGFMMAGGSNTPGASEIIYMINTPYQGQGLGKSVITTFVSKIAPIIKKIGQGNDNIAKAFQCYNGIALTSLEATASPANEASWKILEAAGFEAAKLDNAHLALDFSQKGLSMEALENEILKHYQKDSSFALGSRYPLIDIYGKSRTFSVNKDWQKVKFHFEKYLD